MAFSCDHGCVSADKCSGSCQPKPKIKVRPGSCKYCRDGVRLIDGEHWIVKSIVPARITIATCKEA